MGGGARQRLGIRRWVSTPPGCTVPRFRRPDSRPIHSRSPLRRPDSRPISKPAPFRRPDSRLRGQIGHFSRPDSRDWRNGTGLTTIESSPFLMGRVSGRLKPASFCLARDSGRWKPPHLENDAIRDARKSPDFRPSRPRHRKRSISACQCGTNPEVPEVPEVFSRSSELATAVKSCLNGTFLA